MILCSKFLRINIFALSLFFAAGFSAANAQEVSSPKQTLMGHFGPLLFDDECLTCAADLINELSKVSPSLLKIMLENTVEIVQKRRMCSDCVQIGESRFEIEAIKSPAAANAFAIALTIRWGDCMAGCSAEHAWRVEGEVHQSKKKNSRRPLILRVTETGLPVPENWKNL
jgi:hypothetical protein